MTSMVSDSLDYATKSISHPTYQYSRIYPQVSIGNGLQVDTTAETTFEIPPRTLNLCKSFLSFTVTVPNMAVAATSFNHIHADGIPHIQTIQLFNRSGLFLANISYLNKYMNTTARYNNKLQDVLTWDKAGVDGGYADILRSSNDISTSENALRTLTAGLDSKTSYTEPSYVYIGEDVSATPVINYQIPLGRIKESIFGLDLDQNFNETVYIKIIWDSPAVIGYASTTATGLTTLTSLSRYTITKLYLYISIEQNNEIIQGLLNKINTGLSYNIPITYSTKIQSGVSTSLALSIRLNRSHGFKCKRIVWAPYNAIEIRNTSFCHNNEDSGVIVDYYTTLNNTRTAQYNYTDGLDYMKIKESLSGSCIQSSDEFYYNWCHVEDFTNITKLSDKPDTSLYDDGMLLENELIYNITAPVTQNVALNNYIFSICTKKLLITPQGMTLT